MGASEDHPVASAPLPGETTDTGSVDGAAGNGPNADPLPSPGTAVSLGTDDPDTAAEFDSEPN